MEIQEKFTVETWPASPERQTLEAKNKFLGFWLFLGGETVLFATLFATYLALKDKVPVLIMHWQKIYLNYHLFLLQR